MRYVLDFGSANAGGSPAFTVFARLDTGGALTPPAITEIGQGLYSFEFDWNTAPSGVYSVIYKAVLGADELSDVLTGPVSLSRTYEAGVPYTTSELDLLQMALANIGETTTVQSLASPTTKAEKLGALLYGRTRDRVLAAHDWTFATRRLKLTPLLDHERNGWAYVYSLPSDLLRVISIDAGDGYRSLPGPQAPRWVIEANDLATGKVLCTDVADAVLIYTAQILDPMQWDGDFQNAVVWAVAAALCMPLSVKPDLAQLAYAMAKQTLSEAIADDANERRPDADHVSEIITARYW